MTLTVTDSKGKVVYVLDAVSGDPAVTQSLYLSAGTYTLAYTYRSVSGRPAAPIRYHLAQAQLSDGVGTYAPMTMLTPTTTSTSSTTTSTSSTTFLSPSTSPVLGTWYFF